MSQYFDGLNIAQYGETAITVTIADLLHRTWRVTWLA
jgi:hypothetical protein